MATLNEIRDMFQKGITLDSGVELTPKDIIEINYILKIGEGMDIYAFSSENLAESEDDGRYPYLRPNVPFNADFYSDLVDSCHEYIRGQNEMDEVERAVNIWEINKCQMKN